MWPPGAWPPDRIGAALEAVQDIVLVGSLQSIVQAADNIVAAGCLTAGQNDTNYQLLCFSGVLALLEGDFGLAVGIGEQSSNLFLVCYALGCAAFAYADFGNAVSQDAGQFGGVLISCYLERRKLHNFALLAINL